jgi:hypothetical protein
MGVDLYARCILGAPCNGGTRFANQDVITDGCICVRMSSSSGHHHHHHRNATWNLSRMVVNVKQGGSSHSSTVLASLSDVAHE